MSPQIDISVVVPLYNKRYEIERSIQSVLGQSFQRFELIVVDDGSTDGSDTVAEQVDDRRFRLVRQANAGVSAARNRGIREASAGLIAFLDADDEWTSEFLATIWSLYQRYPSAGIYGTAYQRCLPNGHLEKLYLPQIPESPWSGIVPNYFRVAQDAPLLWSSAVAIPKNVFAVVGNFPIGVPIGEDVDMWLRVALRYPVAFSHTYHAIYHQGASNRAMQQGVCNENLVLAETAFHALDQSIVPQKFKQDLLEYVYMYQLITATECAKAGNLEYARELLTSCRHTIRFRKQWLWWRFWIAMPAPLFHMVEKVKGLLSTTGLIGQTSLGVYPAPDGNSS